VVLATLKRRLSPPMTELEFDTAVAALIQGGQGSIKNDHEERVFVAATFVIQRQRKIPDDEPWGGPTDQELAEFLTGIDRIQRKKLKAMADGLIKSQDRPTIH
jgi:hypothetical protein